MPSLNLSRLAARGRASESAFFKSEQLNQAKKIRSKLTPADLSHLSTPSNSAPTIDTLSEISAHSAYRKLLRHPPRDPIQHSSSRSTLLTRLSQADDVAYAGMAPPARQAPVDPGLLRALGSSRLRLVTGASAQGRPLPGGERYAEGVVLGVGAFGVATAVVGGVGLLGLGWMYMNPAVVDRMREGAVWMRGGMEGAFGYRMKAFVARMNERGPILSERAKERAGRIAEGVRGRRRATNVEEAEQGGESRVSGGRV